MNSLALVASRIKHYLWKDDIFRSGGKFAVDYYAGKDGKKPIYTWLKFTFCFDRHAFQKVIHVVAASSFEY